MILPPSGVLIIKLLLPIQITFLKIIPFGSLMERNSQFIADKPLLRQGAQRFVAGGQLRDGFIQYLCNTVNGVPRPYSHLRREDI